MQKILLGKKGQLMGKLNKETNNNVNIQVAVAVGLKVMSTITIAIKILNIKCKRKETEHLKKKINFTQVQKIEAHKNICH